MPELAIVAVLILGYTIVAARLDRRSISGPIVLVTAGALLGPAGLHAIETPATSLPVQILAELTLAILLFTDASTIGLREAGRIARLPGRLLGVGLPLTTWRAPSWAGFSSPRWASGSHSCSGRPRPDRCRPQPAAPAGPRHPCQGPPRDQHRERAERRHRDPVRDPVPRGHDRRGDVRRPALAHRGRWKSPSPSWSRSSSAGWVGRWSRWPVDVDGRRPTRNRSASMALLAYAAATTLDGNGFVAAFAAGVAFRT